MTNWRGVVFPLDHTKYRLVSIIGRGTYSKVYKAICTDNGLTVVVKIIDLEEYPLSLETIMKQTAFWSKCAHKNIVSYFGSFVNGSQLWILTEFMFGGSVSDILKLGYGQGIKDESIVAAIIRSVVRGLRYFHRNKEIHRDVRSGNILISQTGIVKISDFGLATSLIQGGRKKIEAISVYGDACYMAPEILNSDAGYSEKTDIWSLGLTVIELATGKMPYEGKKFMESMVLILSENPPELPKEGYSAAIRDFVSCCLRINPEKRATASELMNHKFLKNAGGNEAIANSIIGQMVSIEERFKLIHGDYSGDLSSLNAKVSNNIDFSFDFACDKDDDKEVKGKQKGRFSIISTKTSSEGDKIDKLTKEVELLTNESLALENENAQLKNRVRELQEILRSQNKQ